MSRLDELLQIASANSEEAFNDLADLMSPEKFTKEELSSNMEEALGYDPISYHDKKFMEEYFDKLLDNPDISSADKLSLKDDKEKILSDAYTMYQVDSEGTMMSAVDASCARYGIIIPDNSEYDENEEDVDEDDDEDDDEN